jgi:hypothetical protein
MKAFNPNLLKSGWPPQTFFSLRPPFSFWPTNLFSSSSSLFVPPQLPLGPISRGPFGPLQLLRPAQSSSRLSPVHQPAVALQQPAPGPSEPAPPTASMADTTQSPHGRRPPPRRPCQVRLPQPHPIKLSRPRLPCLAQHRVSPPAPQLSATTAAWG